jgi:hypothetical protein
LLSSQFAEARCAVNENSLHQARKIAPELIKGAYVASDSVAKALQAQGFIQEIQIDPHLFFR